MSEQIKKSDISEKYIFEYIIVGAEKAQKEIDAMNLALKETAQISKNTLKGKPTDASGLKATEQAIKASNLAMKEKLKLENDLIKIEAQRMKAERLLNNEVERTNKATEKAIQNEQRLNGVYSKVQQKLNSIVSEYRELAIKKELGSKLTLKEEQRYTFLQARLVKYDDALKRTDASMGKFQRNVGNYKSGFDGLGMSVSQLAREMPAFANSAQTGFMAISNNLPMFFDEIQKIKKANIELAQSGQPTTSLFKQLGSSILSVGTLLSVGVTLLTVYGGEIVKWLSGETKVEKALRARKEAQKKANEESERARKNMFAETGEFVGYLLALSKTNEGSKERYKLMGQINEQYGTTLKNMSNEAMFQAQINSLMNDYIDYKRQEYRIKKNEELIGLNLAKQDELRIKIAKEEAIAKVALSRVESVLASGLKDVNRNRIEEQQGLTESRRKIAEYKTELGLANMRLQQYGFSMLDANMQIEDYGFKTKGATKDTKDATEALEDYTRAVKDLQNEMITNERDREKAQLKTQFENELADIKSNGIKANEMKIELRKKYQFDLDALNEKYRLEDEAKLNEANDALLQEMERMREVEFEMIEQEEKEKNLILKKSSKSQKEIDKEITKNHIEALKERIALGQMYGKDTLDLELELADLLRKQQEDKLKKQFETAKKWVDLTADYFIKRSEEKIAQLDKEIEASQKQYDTFAELAKNGNIQAQQSLAEQQNIINEANRKKMAEQKRIERLKLAETAFNVYGAKVEAGDKNPLVSTIKDITLLSQFISALPAFEDGTENTGANGRGVDGKGGFHAILHPHERVLTKEQNSAIGDLTNAELSNLALKYNTGQLIDLKRHDVAGNSYDLIPLLSKLDAVEKAILNKPEHNIELGKITQTTMQIVESSKRGNITNRNIYSIKRR
jgi:hypothetical protein